MAGRTGAGQDYLVDEHEPARGPAPDPRGAQSPPQRAERDGRICHPWRDEDDEMNGTGGGRDRLRRSGFVAGGLAAAALLAAACGGTGSPTLNATTAYQKSLAYAQCMRADGEPGYPDPTSNGGFILNGQKDHLNGALMNSANRKCQHLLPRTAPMTAAQQRQATAQALRYVACMRTHGIPDMPDPQVNSQGIEFSIGGPHGHGPPPNSPVLHAAMRACQKLLPGGPP
jgi:hypothetical protein